MEKYLVVETWTTRRVLRLGAKSAIDAIERREEGEEVDRSIHVTGLDAYPEKGGKNGEKIHGI